MHQPRIILLPFLFFFGSPAFSQIQYDNVAIKLLLSDSLKYHRTYSRSSLVWDDFAHNSGNVLKINDELYYIPDQYGAVFKIRKIGDSIAVNRIDKTKFSGFAGSQYCFYKKQLYSFGGYGYWQINGQLRNYVAERYEWDIVKLNEVIPSNNFFTYYDQVNGFLWCGMQDYINEVLTSDNFKTHYFAYRLNIENHKWENLGLLTYRPTSSGVQEGIVMETPFGVIVSSGGPKFQVWDFANNRKYELNSLSDSLRIHYAPTLNSIRYSLFYINRHIIIYDHGKHEIFKSFQFDPGNLELIDEKVYTKAGTSTNYYWFLSILLIPISAMLFRRWNSRKANPESGLNIVPDRTNHFQHNDILRGPSDKGIAVKIENSEGKFFASLTNLELELLKTIANDTRKGIRTSADELNRMLGTENKSMDVQKKHRSDILISINHKYSKVFGLNILLVEKARTETDKRLFEYYLNDKASLINLG